MLEDSDASDICRIRLISWGVDGTTLLVSVCAVVRLSDRAFSSTDAATSRVADSHDALEESIFYTARMRKQIRV